MLNIWLVFRDYVKELDNSILTEAQESRVEEPIEEERGSRRGRKWDEERGRDRQRRDSRDRGRNKWDRDGEKSSSHRRDSGRHHRGECIENIAEARNCFIFVLRMHE